DLEAGLAAATRIGYPVMLKSTAGGGGIGLRLCANAEEFVAAFESVRRLGETHFKHAGAYLEKYVARARHVEVQVFGDGKGRVVALGERDCSLQRRNQKVIEETPAPNLKAEVREALASSAVRLMESVSYRSAGTVEFIVDAETADFYFLEVNTRLQVEHGVTEEVRGVDLVEWMVRAADESAPPIETLVGSPRGHSIQARIYAEDPAKAFQPSSGLLTEVSFPPPERVRVDTWVERGTEVTPFYDPLIAKVVVWGETRAEAVEKLGAALSETRISGIETNLQYLRQVIRAPDFANGRVTTQLLPTIAYASAAIDVLVPGTQSTVQDYPGRLGYWAVGIPPSGPMDSLALRLGNRVLGNDPASAALELTMTGPTLKFRGNAVIALAGPSMAGTLDGVPVPSFEPVTVHAGQTLVLGAIRGAGARTYLCVRGGFDVPSYLGSRATFTLGGFGGHGGRALRTGDVLHVLESRSVPSPEMTALPESLVPAYDHHFDIGVLEGPHAAPDFFTEEFIERFYDVAWKVHYNSARTGVRLMGPKPTWVRPDGGEAGLHPSNIHDTAYAIGAVDFTGDMPIILGPDGPSLGGFVCPVTIVRAELWKMGQLKPGDTVRFRPWSDDGARSAELAQEREILTLTKETAPPPAVARTSPILGGTKETPGKVQVTYRRSGDSHLLVEYGPMVLDLALRLRVHVLMRALEDRKLPGVVDLTPGIRSLQIHYDARVLPEDSLLSVLRSTEESLGDL
ncbi:MAG TPA: 5-oxoprolinase/urea amidolyase family protein, partial [Polyangiaceae bacterium]